jgi:hypothetical protein
MMDKISKLVIVGIGEREIVSAGDMTYELDGSILKVYLAPESKLLPLELTPIMGKGGIDG